MPRERDKVCRRCQRRSRPVSRHGDVSEIEPAVNGSNPRIFHPEFLVIGFWKEFWSLNRINGPSITTVNDLEMRDKGQTHQSIPISSHDAHINRSQGSVLFPVDNNAFHSRIPAGQRGMARASLPRLLRHTDQDLDAILESNYSRIEGADDFQ